MNHTGRSVLTATRKRKDRGAIDEATTASFYNPSSTKKQQQHNTTSSSARPGEPVHQVPVCSNRILAGYMAHEFLTRGTLLGQKFDPARAEAVPVSAAESKRKPPSQTAAAEPESSAVKTTSSKKVREESSRSYAEVAHLLKADGGAHIPGIVNPTQLARWIQM